MQNKIYNKMEVIENKYGHILINFNRIKPFYNICKVTGKRQLVNIKIDYIPDKYLIEIGSYRKYFKKEFNMYIEEICSSVSDLINELVKPKYLSVTVYLEGNISLTDWSVTKITNN